jgi:hypothetical protein
MSEIPEDESVLGSLWDAGSEALSGVGDVLDAGYHAGVAGVEFALGDESGAAHQWDQAGDSIQDAGGHFDQAGQDVQNAYDQSGIDASDLTM